MEDVQDIVANRGIALTDDFLGMQRIKLYLQACYSALVEHSLAEEQKFPEHLP
jgi:hypothetical protein